MKPKVKISGPVFDSTGYGQASRDLVAALFFNQTELSVEPVVTSPDRTSFGWQGELCKQLKGRLADYQIQLIVLTPDNYPKFIEKGKYNIAYLYWETDKLPYKWIKEINLLDEIWTSSDYFAQVFKTSGVKIPVHVFPPSIDIYGAAPGGFFLPKFSGYLFYSVFQWTERKNPETLLKTYWQTFTGAEDVALLLKTHRTSHQPSEFAAIKEDIARWKVELGLAHYPKIFLIEKLFTIAQMRMLHATGDCFVTASSGEGWCIPAVEAARAGNPVIAINKTGFADYMQGKYLACQTVKAPVTPLTFIDVYSTDMNWFNINPQDLSDYMLWAYNNRDKARKLGQEGQAYVSQHFNYWDIGKAMKERLTSIANKL